MPKKVLTMADKILLASELFTDREEPRQSFWKSYQKCKDGVQNSSRDIFVLTYYGVGGIGKSSLLKKLMSEMDAQVENPRYVYYDFDIRQDMTSVLISIRNILSDRYQFSFPLFDLGIHIYDRKTGKDITAPEVKSYADKSPILNLILTATGNIPIVGVVSLLVQVADKGAAIIKNVIDKHKRDIKLMESKSPEELYHSLQYFFALDMADNLKGADEPLVFFLDTYERLVNEMLFIGEPLNNDIWIRGEEGLVQNIPNVLWVIAGREILQWEQFDPDWADTLEQHLLGHLSQSDAQQFLQKAGIVDSSLQLQLYELTEGLPLFLDLCVKHFQVLVGKNVTPEISDFGNDMSTLTERFVKYMDSSMKDMFYMLSCLEVWDDRMIENLAEKIPEAFSYSAYDKVRDFSFINHGDGSHYYMHQTVRAVLLKQCPESLKNKTSRKMTEYCMDRLAAKDVSIADCEYYLPLLVAYGLWTYTQDEELANFMSGHIHKYIEMLIEYGRFQTADAVMEPIWKLACGRKDTLFYAYAVYNYSFILRRERNDMESIGYGEEALAILGRLLGEEHPDTLLAMGNLANVYFNVGRKREALRLNEIIFEKRKRILGENHEDTLSTMINLACLYSAMGKYDAALKLEETALNKIKEALGENDLLAITAMGNLANSYADVGRYEESLELNEMVLEKHIQLFGEKHPDIIVNMVNLATVYAAMGKYEEALLLEETILEKSREIFRENHPNMTVVMSNLSITYFRVGRYEEALKLQERVLEKRRELLGEEHPDTLRAMFNLADTYAEMGRTEEALKLQERVLEKQRELLGEEHPDTLRTMGDLANSYAKMGRTEEALMLREMVLEKRRELLGEEHPDTLRAMGDLANSYAEMGRTEEALTLRKMVLEKRRELLGEEHPDTLRAMGNLAISYAEMGRTEEALKLQEMVLEKNRKLLGADHRGTILAMNNLACSYQTMHRDEEALKLREMVLEKRRELLGENHLDTLRAMVNLAISYSDIGRAEEALKLLEAALEKSTKFLGKNHPISHQTVKRLAKLYSTMGMEKKMLRLQETLKNDG